MPYTRTHTLIITLGARSREMKKLAMRANGVGVGVGLVPMTVLVALNENGDLTRAAACLENHVRWNNNTHTRAYHARVSSSVTPPTRFNIALGRTIGQ